jgi:hypothetical protein
MITSFTGFIYLLLSGGTNQYTPFYLVFMSMLSGLMALTVEPGITKEQHDKMYGALIVFFSFIIVIIFMTSCSSKNGYGCRGNQSWNKMVKRIN